jgi:S1-C subfamily serine protease
VVEGSPAALGGLRPEDTIVELDGAGVGGIGEIQKRMLGEAIGRPIRVLVVRGGELRELELVPAELEV